MSSRGGARGGKRAVEGHWAGRLGFICLHVLRAQRYMESMRLKAHPPIERVGKPFALDVFVQHHDICCCCAFQFACLR